MIATKGPRMYREELDSYGWYLPNDAAARAAFWELLKVAQRLAEKADEERNKRLGIREKFDSLWEALDV